MPKQRNIRSASGLLFDVLFPENNNFRPTVSGAAGHVIIRAMMHLNEKRPMTPEIAVQTSIMPDMTIRPYHTWED